MSLISSPSLYLPLLSCALLSCLCPQLCVRGSVEIRNCTHSLRALYCIIYVCVHCSACASFHEFHDSMRRDTTLSSSIVSLNVLCPPRTPSKEQASLPWEGGFLLIDYTVLCPFPFFVSFIYSSYIPFVSSIVHTFLFVSFHYFHHSTLFFCLLFLAFAICNTNKPFSFPNSDN